MQHDLFSSLDSFQALSVAASALLVRDVAGQYRSAEADEVLLAAQHLLAAQVRGSDLLDSPAVVKDVGADRKLSSNLDRRGHFALHRRSSLPVRKDRPPLACAACVHRTAHRCLTMFDLAVKATVRGAGLLSPVSRKRIHHIRKQAGN